MDILSNFWMHYSGYLIIRTVRFAMNYWMAFTALHYSDCASEEDTLTIFEFYGKNLL